MTTSSTITKPVTTMPQKNCLSHILLSIVVILLATKAPILHFISKKKDSFNHLFFSQHNFWDFISVPRPPDMIYSSCYGHFPTLDCILLPVKYNPQSITAPQWSGTCCNKHSHTTCCHILLEKEHSKKIWSLDSHLFLQNPHNKFPCQPHLTNLSKVESLSWIANQKINACFGMMAASQTNLSQSTSFNKGQFGNWQSHTSGYTYFPVETLALYFLLF